MPRLPDDDSLPEVLGDGLEAAYPGLYEMTDEDVRRHGTAEANAPGVATPVRGEIVEYDPDDEDTYPSVCVDPAEVLARFGFRGGERLLFDEHGAYVGQIVKTIETR